MVVGGEVDFIDRYLYLVDLFVKQVGENGRPIYKYRLGGQCLPERRFISPVIERTLSSLGQILESYCSQYQYSPRVALFFSVIKELGWPAIVGPYPDSIVSEHMTFGLYVNELVTRLHDRSNTAEFREVIRKQTSDLNKQLAEYVGYFDSLFDVFARLLVVRVDLRYQHHVCEQEPLMLERLRMDFSRFKKKMDMADAFAYLVGYIAVVEYGEIRRHHVHLILFYDGSKRLRDVSIAEKVGELWVYATSGDGEFHNCNRSRDRYRFLGIGMINHSDTEKREVFTKLVLPYFFKRDQLLQYKTSKKMRRIFRGESPERPAIKLGRPRA